MDQITWTGLIVHEIKDQLESEFEVCDGPGAIVTCVGGGGLAIGKVAFILGTARELNYRKIASTNARY